MAPEYISTIFALSAVIVICISIIVRIVFRTKFDGKEAILKLAKNWDKIRYFSYIMVGFFIVCSIVVGLEAMNAVFGYTIHGTLEILELILDFTLFVIGVILLLLVSNRIWGDGE